MKSTLNINDKNLSGLRSLVKDKKITSLTNGVNLAIELLLKKYETKDFAEEMAKAKNDDDFIQRTLSCQNDFEKIGDNEW